jgi:hypothetical protein
MSSSSVDLPERRSPMSTLMMFFPMNGRMRFMYSGLSIIEASEWGDNVLICSKINYT